MGKIILLDELTSNQIAAGEVIERPASVVKELVENSIDAGSTQIHIEVMNGGINKIKITDNGYGMDVDDALLAFQRHATSKIRKADDLFKISTLGFRGEALPSIASIAKLVLVTKEEGALEGTRVEIAGGKIMKSGAIGASTGTCIDVTELFFNTPARRKYLKTETTEFGHISDAVTRLALGNPNISFVLSHNGRVVFRTPGTNKLVDVLSTIYGIEIARNLITVNNETEILNLTGVVAKPTINRANRQQQTFFVNGRYIKSKIIGYALEESFHTLLPTGRYPFAFLNLTINPELVDVNVHPTKMEVRFSNEKDIIKLLTRWIQEALGKEKLIPGYDREVEVKVHQQQLEKNVKYDVLDNIKENQQDNKHKGFEDIFIGDKTTKYVQNEFLTQSLFLENKTVEKNVSYQNTALDEVLSQEKTHEIKENTVCYELLNYDSPREIIESNPSKKTSVELEVSNQDKLPFLRPLAQLDKTYIIAQGIKGMFIIDQHAAHERILYEKYLDKDSKRNNVIQSLLVPITLELTPKESQILINNILVFTDLGFIIEHFGGNTFIIRGIPQELSQTGEEVFFKDLLDYLSEDINYLKKEKLREKIIINMACKGAIKANQSLTIGEMEELINQLSQTGTPYTCPHGRPTIIHFSSYELEKKFKRV